MASLADFDENSELVTAELGNLGLTAAGFDYFNLEEPIEFCTKVDLPKRRGRSSTGY
ncbi:MAG: hypothetical protein J6M93_05740 [Succinivibrio sp.]|nr:hypothetical protein [Succinivibrio sp.]